MADLLPLNATQLEKDLSDTIKRISDVPVPVDTLWNPDTCPEALLPWLAWAMSVDEWDPNWSVAYKREVIKASVNIHRHKGTIGALNDALAALGMNLDVVEWFQEVPIAAAYTFAVNLYLNTQPFTLQEQTNIFNIIKSSKNKRSLLSFLHIYQEVQTAVPVIGAAVSTSQHITIEEGP